MYKSFVIAASAAAVSASTYQNPLIVANVPDPGVLRTKNGQNILVTTSNYSSDPAKDDAFPIRDSKDMIHWEDKAHVFTHGQWPSWVERDMWAPEMHVVNGCYRVYYTGRNKDTGALSIGTAVNCDSPFGPFKDLGEPLHQNPIGVIDATYFHNPADKKHYLIWKIDGNSQGKPTPILARELNKEGDGFADGSEEFELIRDDLPWEFVDGVGCTEGPWIMHNPENGYYYLYYSS